MLSKRYRVRGTRYEIQGAGYEVRGARYGARGTGHVVRDTRYVVQGTWYRSLEGTNEYQRHHFCTYGIEQAGLEPPCQKGGWWGL